MVAKSAPFNGNLHSFSSNFLLLITSLSRNGRTEEYNQYTLQVPIVPLSPKEWWSSSFRVRANLSKIVLFFLQQQETIKETKNKQWTLGFDLNLCSLSYVDSAASRMVQDESDCWLSDSRKDECFLRFPSGYWNRVRILSKLGEIDPLYHSAGELERYTINPSLSSRRRRAAPDDMVVRICQKREPLFSLSCYTPPHLPFPCGRIFWGGFGRPLTSLCLHHCCQRQALSLSMIEWES